MVDLTYRAFTFCQFFFNRDTKKLIPRVTFETISSSVIPILPIATAKQRTFRRKKSIVIETALRRVYSPSSFET